MPAQLETAEPVGVQAVQELRRIVDRVRRNLKRDGNEKRAQVFKLRLQGYTIAEIAERVGCSVATVKRHWKFAEDMLRDKLNDSNSGDLKE